MTDPDLAERVRTAWLRAIERHDLRPAIKVVAEIAQAEYGRGWNAALEAAGKMLCTGLPWYSIRTLQRPQQHDKPAEQVAAHAMTGMVQHGEQPALAKPGAPPAFLSDAEILERAAEISRREDILDEVGNELLEENAERLRAQAQPAPEVDVFEAFEAEWFGRAEVAEAGEGEQCARDWFGPALKALERDASFARGHKERCGCPSCESAKAWTALRERARRVGR